MSSGPTGASSSQHLATHSHSEKLRGVRGTFILEVWQEVHYIPVSHCPDHQHQYLKINNGVYHYAVSSVVTQFP